MILAPLILWLAVAAFAGAGIFNAIGTRATQQSFVKWGYPAWWCRITGLLEIAAAALIAITSTRAEGLVLGGVIIATAALTVVRHRDWSHLGPLAFFTVLMCALYGVH